MGTHNKRSKAAAVSKKERKAAAHSGNHYHSTPHHFHHRHGYLSDHASHRQNANPKSSHDVVDPLDAQLFDYMMVVDVEATTAQGCNNYPHEIIEFPAVLIDVRRGVVMREESFHTYVKPQRRTVLSPFCTALTGIRQEQVDAAPVLREAVEKFIVWLHKTIPLGAKVVFCADGPWDFKKFFYEYHVLRDGIALPTMFYEYIDIRTSFSRRFNNGVPQKLNAMLAQMGLTFQGREHNGFDDAYNIARLALAAMQQGCIFDFLVCIPLTEDTTHYTIDTYPIYRREEGSGQLDRDVVEDVAKHHYGSHYFEFGQRLQADLLSYRMKHPENFNLHRAVVMQQRATRQKQRVWKRRVKYMAMMVFLLLLAVLVYCYYWLGVLPPLVLPHSLLLAFLSRKVE